MSKRDLLPQSTILQAAKNKNSPLAPILLVITFIMLMFPQASFADVAACGCYCGKVLSPQCSDDACKSAWRRS
jgi:hypothetical protein